MIRQPSIIKIVTIDYFAFLAALIPPICWGFYLMLLATKSIFLQNPSLPVVFMFITITAIGVGCWRIQLIKTIFSDGIEEIATISNIFFFRDRGRVEYIFLHQNQKHLSGAAIHKVKQTRALNIGDQVTVVVDRNHPKRAFIRDLYI